MYPAVAPSYAVSHAWPLPPHTSVSSSSGAAAGASSSSSSSAVTTLCWPLSSPPPAPSCLWVCIALHPRNSLRNVDRGPPPEAAAAAAAFTSLWGPQLAELRRFADGGIVNAVVWDTAKLGGRNHARDAIVPLIVSHILNRHVYSASHSSHSSAVTIGATTGGGRNSNSSSKGGSSPATLLLPSGVLHAGDHLCVSSPSSSSPSPSAAMTSAAHALLASDVSRACPGLALERVLDAGGCVTATSTVTTAAAASSSGSASSLSSAKGKAAAASSASPALITASVSSKLALPSSGISLPSNFSLQDVTAADPLSKGPGAAFSSASAAFDVLASALRGTRGLPLKVSSVVPACASLRRTAAHAPCPHPLAAAHGVKDAAAADGDGEDAAASAGGALAAILGGAAGGNKPLSGEALLAAATLAAATSSPSPLPSASSSSDALAASQLLQPMPVVVTLEGSGKWPDDVDAIAALKTAFYLKMKYSLSGGGVGSDGTSLARGAVVVAEARPDGLRVALGGYAFVLTLHHPRELALLERLARRGPLARTYPPPVTAAAAATSSGRGKGEAAASSSAGKAVRGFVNVAPVGIAVPEPAPKRRKGGNAAADIGPEIVNPSYSTAAPNAAPAGGVVRGKIKGEANMKPLAATEGMAVLRAQLGLGPSSSSSSSAVASKGGRSAAASGFGGGGVGGQLSPEEAGLRLDALYLRCVAAPRHSQAVAALAARFSAYGPTVRLACLWLSSLGCGPEDSGGAPTGTAATVPPVTSSLRAGAALADDASSAASAVVAAYHSSLAAEALAYESSGPHMRQELIELLVAHLFVNPGPQGVPPSSPALGLLRFLSLLCRHDWAGQPLLVDTDISHLLDADDAAADAAAAAASKAKHGSGGSSSSSDARTLASRFRAVRSGEVAVAPSDGNDVSADEEEDTGEESGFSSEARASKRKHPYGPALYVVTPAERGAWRPLWSRCSPSWQVLQRIVTSARDAEAALTAALAPVIPAAAECSSVSSGGAACFYHPPSSLLSLYEPTSSASAASDSPFAIFGSANDDIVDGSSVRAALVPAAAGSPYHAVVALKPALTSRSTTDGRAFGPVKPPVALASAVWDAPLALLRSASAAAAAASSSEASSDAVDSDSVDKASQQQASASAAAAPHLQLVAAAAAKPHGAPSSASGGKAGVSTGGKKGDGSSGGGGGTLVLCGGLRDGSKLTLPLHRNLLGSSRSSLCWAFDPIGCYLAALRGTSGGGPSLGRHASFFLQPPQHSALSSLLQAPSPLLQPAPGASTAAAVVALPDTASASVCSSIGVVWKEGGTNASAAGTSDGKRAAIGALALATVPLIASTGAGLVRSVTMA